MNRALLSKKQLICSNELRSLFLRSLAKRCASSLTDSSSSVPASQNTKLGTPKIPIVTIEKPEERSSFDDYPYTYSPAYRPSRFDWLFDDGWRRPPARDQGGRLRRNWVCLGYNATDEYEDWKMHHQYMFVGFTVMLGGLVFFVWYHTDWPKLEEWATREAFLEIARREKYGLPYISKDYINPAKIAATLPSDEELGDFEIII